MPARTSLRMPELIIIGAMKGGTSALHRYLHDHPDIAMSAHKELNFFFGPEKPSSVEGEHAAWHEGNWYRGLEWYASQFDESAPMRGESSPGYTSPSHPEAAGRIAAVAPQARLIYLVRDPLARAVSQYLHHAREGDEQRPIDAALLDARSQYISRSRYFERVAPFLANFPREHICVLGQEELLADRRGSMATVYEFAGVDPDHWTESLNRRWHTHGGERVAPSPAVRTAFCDAVADDVARLRSWSGKAFRSWMV